MKKAIFLFSILTFSFAVKAQDSNVPKKTCFEEYYEAFTRRGAYPVPDGEHNVVYSARKDGECYCGEAKMNVKNGDLAPSIQIKKQDGSYEPAKKVLHPKTNQGEAENINKFGVFNGMSASFLTDDYWIINLFFVDYLKPDNGGNAVAPNVNEIKAQSNQKPTQELNTKEKEIITKAYEGLVFETGKSKIKSSSYSHLNLLASLLNENPTYTLAVNGYTDNTGKPESNLVLSKARAQSVKEYLVKQGVGADRITANGFGIENPIADNKTAEGRAKNRRVEFIMTK